jgi:hypothetical protein
MDQWLTLRETCFELRMGGRAVLSLIRSGQLVGFRLPKRGRNRGGAWRILYPGLRFARYLEECKRHVEHVPLLTGREAAELLAVTPAAIRQLKRRRRLRGTKVGPVTLFTAAEIRRFLFQREKASRQGSRKMYSPILATWLRRLVAQDELIDVQVLDGLLHEAVGIREPGKSQYIVEIWGHFDAINELLRSARLGEDIAHAVKKARSPDWIPARHLKKLSDILNFGKANSAFNKPH